MADLFEAAGAGDPAAQAEIARLVRGFARQVCRGGGPSGSMDSSWEDVAQEASRKIFTTGLARFRGMGTERSFLYSVVRLTVIQMSRTANRRNRREEALPPPPRSHERSPDWRIDVMKILSRLPQDCRELMGRVFLSGEMYCDLAKELRLEESSVRSRVSRCLKQARQITEEGPP
jgi:RNA polymerase sigma factor (sigma-70 family)